jgi:hypothetical protein
MPRTVPDAKAALIALLQGVTWPGTPQPEVKYGQPTEGEDAPFGGEMVFLGETRAVAEPPGLGSRRDETYNLRFVVDVRHDGDDEQTVENRAWELLEAAENAIWQNNTLSQTVNRVTRVESNQVNVPEPQAWRTQIVTDVTVVAAPVV